MTLVLLLLIATQTYAIEDIAKLLVESSDLSRQKHAAKR